MPSAVSRFLLKPVSKSYLGVYACGLSALYYYGFELPAKTVLLSKLVLGSTWLGLIGSISFMEAWVKFHAPTVPKPYAFDIGRHVFSALNLVERNVSFVALVLLMMNGTVSEYVPVGIVWFQTIFVIPTLLERAKMIDNQWKDTTQIAHAPCHDYF